MDGTLVSLASEEMKRLDRDIAKKREQLGKVQEELNSLRRKRDGLAAFLGVDEGSGVEGGSTGGPQAPGRVQELKGDALREKLLEILRGAGKPLHYKRDLVEALRRAGFQPRGKDPAGNIIAHMLADPKGRFEKKGQGLWEAAKRAAAPGPTADTESLEEGQ